MATRVRLGRIHADRVDFAEALARLEELVAARAGGYVVTPNVDHVVLAERDEELRAAYAGAALSLVDGMPLVWLSRVLGQGLPERIAGADLVGPLAALAAARGWRVSLIGGRPGVGLAARDRLVLEHPDLQVVGVEAPEPGFEGDAEACAELVVRVRATRPELVLVALGCPKQELFMHRFAAELAPAVALGVGAAIDFLAGTSRRAPGWMSRVGLEWAFRLAQEPRRLAHRYLVRDRAIAGIALRMLWMPQHERAWLAPALEALAPVLPLPAASPPPAPTLADALATELSLPVAGFAGAPFTAASEVVPPLGPARGGAADGSVVVTPAAPSEPVIEPVVASAEVAAAADAPDAQSSRGFEALRSDRDAESTQAAADAPGPAPVREWARRARVIDAADDDVVPREGGAQARLGEDPHADDDARREEADERDEGVVARGE